MGSPRIRSNFATFIRPWTELPLPSEDAKKAGLTERELKMARQLVEDMSGDWDPGEFKDEFKDEILRLVDRKVKAGQTETVTQPEPEEGQSTESKGAKILDLTELLQRSLRNKGGGKTKAAADEEDDEEEEEKPASRTKPAAKKRKPAAKAASKTASKTTSKTAPKTASKTTARHRRAA